MSVIIEILDPTDPDDSGFIILGLSGKFFDNANTRSYDVTLKESNDIEVVAAIPANAYPELTNEEEEVEGRCIVIARGTNTFTSKYEQAMYFNAAAVIIANNNNAQPKSILTLYGQISDECFQDHLQDAESFPPCIMISYDSHSRMLKQFNSKPVFNIRMRPVKATDLSLLSLDDIGVIIRSSCIFDNHPLLLESLSYIFHKTSLVSQNSDRLTQVGRIIGDIEVGRGANSLHLSVEQNNLPCLATLLKTSLDTEIRKDDGYTGLHLATEHGRYDAVALLLASGAYIDHPHPIGWTALHFAVYCEHYAIVTLLCEQGASVNALSIDGNSPLHVAAKIGAENCLRKMLEYSVADIFRSSGPLTVLQCAQQNNHMGCCRILHEYSKRVKTANPAGVITWSGQSRVNVPAHPSNGLDSQFNSEKINVLGVCSNPSMSIIDHWYQCCNISTQSGIINLSISSSASLEENTQQLLSLDLERCCFPEYRHGVKCKLLKNIVITILSGCKTIVYRQGMMSLLIPIIEASYHTRSFQLVEGHHASNPTMEANVVNKTVMMFHSILSLFPAIGNYYSNQDSKRNAAIPQLTQAILPLLRFHYPMIYTALVWNEVSLLVFIVPWISTLMAHVLPLKDTLRLWSGLFEMYSAKRLSRSGVNSASNSATSTPRSSGSGKSPRNSSSSNCDMFLVYLVMAGLKSLEPHMVSVTTATTLLAKESVSSSYSVSRNDSNNNLANAGDATGTAPTGPDNTLRKLLETKLTSAVQTASSAVLTASESLALSIPRAGSNLVITKQFSIQNDEVLMQLLTSINNATSMMLEEAEKKTHTERNIFGYIDGKGAADLSSSVGPGPNLLTSLGNMLNSNTSNGGSGGSGGQNSTVGSTGGKGGGSNSTVQQLLTMYYNSSSAASGTTTPNKGSKPNSPSHHGNNGGGGTGVMLHVSPILQVMEKLVVNTDINNLIVAAQKSRPVDTEADLSMWEMFTQDTPKLNAFGVIDLLMTRQEVDLDYHVLVLEVSPESVPFANFQAAVPALHAHHLKRHGNNDENSITNQIVDCVKGLHVDSTVEVVNLDQLQLNGLMEYLKTFAISLGMRVKLNKKPKDEYMKLSALPSMPSFLRSVLPKGSGSLVNSFVLIVPTEVGDTLSEEYVGLLGCLANTLTICGAEQVAIVNSL